MIETVGAVAQLGEHLLCKQGVSGSIPLSSTNFGLDWDAGRPATALGLAKLMLRLRLMVRVEVSLEK
jgi:hypothetical protein